MQVKCQLVCTKTSYCDFLRGSKKTSTLKGHVQMIVLCIEKAPPFAVPIYMILPIKMVRLSHILDQCTIHNHYFAQEGCTTILKFDNT